VKELEALKSLEDIHQLLPGCGFEGNERGLFGVPLWPGARLVLRLAGSQGDADVDDAVEIIDIRISDG
jgi:hypothetical protein